HPLHCRRTCVLRGDRLHRRPHLPRQPEGAVMTETSERTGTRVRTVRMFDDAWTLIGSRSRDASTFIRDMADAGLGFARCYRCFEMVPVEFGDLTGKPLAEWVAEAGKAVT